MQKARLCLGIESTAHTFGVGIVDYKGRILANERSMYKGKGIKPQEAARKHANDAIFVIKKALEKANIKIQDVDLIGFAQGPGLGPCLKVGATIARTLSKLYEKPLIGVNHCVAHIEIGKLLTGARDPIVLYVSGGNTQIIGKEHKRYRIFGETLDIGLGNLLDSFGRSLGIEFPAGPVLDKIYFKGKKYIVLPYTVKGMDLSFSGLLTAAEKLIGEVEREDLIYSLVHTAYAMVTEVCERAMAYAQKNELMVVGGVAASKALKKMLSKMCRDRKAKLFIPDMSACVDNGAMIAWLSLLEYNNGNFKVDEDFPVKQKMRIESTEINW